MQGLPTGWVTFLFTDIEGSTPLWEKMSRVMQSSVSLHHAILRQVIEANGGQVFQILGDAFQAAFPTAEQGLAAAVETQRALQSASWGETGPLQVRMGLHAGQAEISPVPGPGGVQEYANSHTLNRSARVMSAGHGGQILLSQAVKDLVEHNLPRSISLHDLGEHYLKGMSIPEHLYQVEAPGLRADFPPLMSMVRRPNNLPAELTSFIGREAEISLLKQRLTGGMLRLVTLTGAGGTGKTRLALQVGRAVLDSFPDGVWLVELAPLSNPHMVAAAIAKSLGVLETQGKPVTETLAGFLERKNLLLILDNCEHLLDETARVVEILLRRCPRLVILATSREILNLSGEISFRVPSLTLPAAVSPVNTARESPWQLEACEAVRLFTERTLQARPDFILDETNAMAVAAICLKLDGVPLAIELAAARMRAMTAAQIASRLNNVFHLLTGGSRNALPRQQTLKAAVDWSYDLLTPQERVMLQRLSVFASGWTLDAAENICCGGEIELSAVLDLLGSLADKSLVQLFSSGRYGMHEMLRQYGMEKLNKAPDEKASLMERFCSYYSGFLHSRQTELVEKEQPQTLAEVGVEIQNIRSAWEWAVANSRIETIEPMQDGLAVYYMDQCWFHEGEELFASAVERIERWKNKLGLRKAGGMVTPDVELMYGRLLYHHALFCDILGMVDKARPLLRQSLEIFRRLRARRKMAYTLLAQAGVSSSPTEDQLEQTRQSLAIFQEVDDPIGIAKSKFGLGVTLVHQAEYQEGRQLTEEALSIFRETGSQRNILACSRELGYIQWILGEYSASLKTYQESVELSRRMGSQEGIYASSMGIARAESGLGNYQESQRLYRESLAMAEEVGDMYRILIAHCDLGELSLAQGQPEEASQYAEKAVAIAKQIGFRYGETWTLRVLGQAECELGNLSAAREHLRRSLEIGKDENLPALILLTLIAAARLLFAEQQTALAGEILALVYTHPVSWQWGRERAQELAGRFGMDISSDETEAVVRGRSRDLDATTSEMVALLGRTEM